MYWELKKSAAFFDLWKVWFRVVVWRPSQTSCVLQCERGPFFSGGACGSTAGGKLEDKKRTVAKVPLEAPLTHSKHGSRRWPIALIKQVWRGRNNMGLSCSSWRESSVQWNGRHYCHYHKSQDARGHQIVIIHAGDWKQCHTRQVSVTEQWAQNLLMPHQPHLF